MRVNQLYTIWILDKIESSCFVGTKNKRVHMAINWFSPITHIVTALKVVVCLFSGLGL